MKPEHISVLVSYPDHFEIVQLKPEPEAFQKIVGGYIEMVPRPTGTDSGWEAYCNGDGKSLGLEINTNSNVFLNRLYLSEGAKRPFTHHDFVVGPIIWMMESEEESEDVASIPLSYIIRFTNVAAPTSDSGLITVMRDGNDIWVFDQIKDSFIPQQVAERVRAARSREDHGTIEVWAGMTRPAWVELRVEIMDQVGINLHDQREDRSYG